MIASAFNPDGLRPPTGWFALGGTIYAEVVALLARYGVRVDPALRFERSEAPTPSYQPSTRTIRFGVPDPQTPKGRLYWYYVQHLVGAPDLAAVQRAMELPLPWAVAHEVTHHLRHHYGAPTDNDFVEEQVANCIAVALIEEHAVYRRDLPDLQRWVTAVSERTRALSPDTVAYLPGIRLEIGEVLVAQGGLTRATWEETTRFAAETGVPVEDLLLRLRAVTPAKIERARAEQHRAESYFNRRYMASLSEYWLFGTDWLATYLAREVRPSLGEALGRHVLTGDWEASRRDATRLLLEQALRGADIHVAAAAAHALGEITGAMAIPVLVEALGTPRPTVQLAILQALSAYPTGPAAGAARAQTLLEGPAGVRGAAARLLRLAGGRLDLSDPDPGQQAEQALASLPHDPADAYARLGRLLAGDDASSLAALEALGESGPGPLTGSVVARLDAPSARIRMAATRALGRCPEAGPALIRRLDDVDVAVRLAARDVLRTLGPAAWSALLGVATSAPDRVRVEAFCLAVELGAPGADSLLGELGEELLQRARRLARLEARLLAHPELGLLSQSAGEARARLARLTVRAFLWLAGPAGCAPVERALESPDPTHRATGRRLVRNELGRRGAAFTMLLDPPSPRAGPEDIIRPLRASLKAEPAMARAVATFLVPRLMDPGLARKMLWTLSRDPDQFVRAEAEQAAERLAQPLGASMLTTVEKLMFLRAIPTFAAVDLDTLRAAAEATVAQRFAADEPIVVEGEPGEHLYVLTEGRAVVSAGGHALHDLGPRQYFGEMALFDGGPRSATVTATEETTVLRLGRDDFVRLGRRNPEVLLGVIGVLSGRLRNALAVDPGHRSAGIPPTGAADDPQPGWP